MSWRDLLNRVEREFIRRGAARIDRADLERLLARAEELKVRFAREHGLERYLEGARTAIEMLRDYYTGAYRKVPWWAIAAVVFSLLYVLNPFDLIPDFLPLVGACLLMIENELELYRRWKGGAA